MAARVIGITRRPSAADRWLGTEAEPGCSASVRAIANEPVPKSSTYADKGTLAHHVFEHARKERRDPSEYMGVQLPGIDHVVDEEMANHVRNGLMYVDTVMTADPPIFAEGEITLPIELGGHYKESGKSDYFFVSQSATLHVFDYKHGYGISVRANDNPQGQLYALAVLQAVMRMGINIAKVVIHIIQPPRDNYSRYEVSIDGMYDFAQRAYYAAVESDTQNPDGSYGVYRPSKKACQWCPIKDPCPARSAQAAVTMSNRFGLTPTGPQPLEAALGQVDAAVLTDQRDKNQLTIPQLEGIYPHLKSIAKWAEDMQAFIFAKAIENPALFPNLKFIAGNMGRSFKNRGSAIVAMLAAGLTSDEIEPNDPPILTAAQAHSELKRKFKRKEGDRLYEEHLRPVIDVVEGKDRPRLVPRTGADDDAIIPSSSLAERFGVTNTQED